MYISNISIYNYRNFGCATIDFRDGVNLIVGQNNSGKSNLLRAIALVFDTSTKKQLTINDIYSNIPLEDLKKHSPKVTISAALTQSNSENLMGDELVTVSSWLTSLKEPYTAKIQYEFFLPDTEEEKYQKLMENVATQDEGRKVLNEHFLRLYKSKMWVGKPENQLLADSDSLQKFDFQFLDAIRDVERDMYSGKNVLLKNVIDFFMDYDIKSDKSLEKERRADKILARKSEFERMSSLLVGMIQQRLKSGDAEIMSYANAVGALFDKSEPILEGNITESEIYSLLHLVVKQNTGLCIPISHNGLGYNNLIYMSLLLAKMQVDSNGDFLGGNAKVFPILAIEEPEAHLHPTMQFQLLRFLKNNVSDRKVRQIFITSHSTHIASSSELDDIVGLYKENGKTEISYPGKMFYEIGVDGTKKDMLQSKKYVQRFLDATKANILLAEKIILVEGIAEQILLPIFAEYLGKSLEDNHIAVINIGGRYFDHFLYIFDSTKEHAMKRRVACITDIDPVRKERAKESAKYRKCYPYEMYIDSEAYEYKANCMDEYEEGKHPTIRSFSQEKKVGKTLEYQLAYENESCTLLLTPSLSNEEELTSLMTMAKKGKSLEEMLGILRTCDENTRIVESILKSTGWDESEKKKALIASRYLNSVGKGENALELSVALKENLLMRDKEGYIKFAVPTYIKNALEWVCENP